VRDYQLSFIEPFFFGHKLEFSTDLYHRELRYVSINGLYDERRTGTRLGLRRALGSDSLVGGISYTFENVGIFNVDDDAPQSIKDEEGDRLVSKVGLSLTYDTRNHALNPPAAAALNCAANLRAVRLAPRRISINSRLGRRGSSRASSRGTCSNCADALDSSRPMAIRIRCRCSIASSLAASRHCAAIDTAKWAHRRKRRRRRRTVGGNTYWFASANIASQLSND
jgi:hypothetical protein